MKPAAKIMIGLGAAAVTALWASRSRHRAAIRGTTLLMAGAARHLDWNTAREWIERGARVVVYARSAGEVERALRELRRLGPAAAVQVSKPTEVDGHADAGSTTSVPGVLSVVAALGSVARWLWPSSDDNRHDRPPTPGNGQDARRWFGSSIQAGDEQADV